MLAIEGATILIFLQALGWSTISVTVHFDSFGAALLSLVGAVCLEVGVLGSIGQKVWFKYRYQVRRWLLR